MKAIIGSFILLIVMMGCKVENHQNSDTLPALATTIEIPPLAVDEIIISQAVPIRHYFEFLDTFLIRINDSLNYQLDEYLLVRANPWIIDRLADTDYYRLMEQGIFEEDPQSLLALQQGDRLIIPDSFLVRALQQEMTSTRIEVNIPEFKLRVFEGNCLLHTFPIRVGQNKKRYLAMAGREVDLRTRAGKGKIVRVNRDPRFINPKDNKVYETTSRDDGRRTGLPRIPWIEPELNGQRYGQLIHPTTNPVSLGKAYSNGCIGMREEDMWRVYYHAPIGTMVDFYYNLEVLDEKGDTVYLKNIYPGYPTSHQNFKALPASVCSCGHIGQN